MSWCQESFCEELGHGCLTHVAHPHCLDNILENESQCRELEHQARANSLAQSSMPVSVNRMLNVSLLPATIRAFRVTSDSLGPVSHQMNHFPISSEERNWTHSVLGISD